MDQLCKDIHTYQNQLRTNPASGVADVQKIEAQFTDAAKPKLQVRGGGKPSVLTNEGKPAVTEFVDYLKAQKKTHALEWDDAMVPGT